MVLREKLIDVREKFIFLCEILIDLREKLMLVREI
jgi:hypothetical protein